jgi:hypothetical protein
MNTRESNKLILRFMGYRNTTPDLSGINIYENDKGDTQELLCVKYHSSWDWLMPVVKKIREILNVEFSFSEFDDMRELENKLNPYNYDIDHIYKEAVDFIQWYSENN